MSLLTELQRLRLDAHEFYGEQLIDRVIGLAADSLDAAWAEAEAALPEGWRMVQARRMRVGAALDSEVWWAEAVAAKSDMGPGVQPATERAEDENLPAALRALAAKLRER